MYELVLLIFALNSGAFWYVGIVRREANIVV
jgi:hypothetical protein